jgi:hypothetical protein
VTGPGRPDPAFLRGVLYGLCFSLLIYAALALLIAALL